MKENPHIIVGDGRRCICGLYENGQAIGCAEIIKILNELDDYAQTQLNPSLFIRKGDKNQPQPPSADELMKVVTVIRPLIEDCKDAIITSTEARKCAKEIWNMDGTTQLKEAANVIQRAINTSTEALVKEKERILRQCVDTQSLNGLLIEYHKDDNRFYAYQGKEQVWSGEAIFNVWQCVKLAKENAELREDNKALRSWTGCICIHHNDKDREIVGCYICLKKERDTLTARIAQCSKFMEHQAFCEHVTHARPCNCGYEELLQALTPPTKEEQ